MKTRLILVLSIGFVIISGSCFGQISRNPSPKMNKKMYKHFLETNCIYPDNSMENTEEGTVEISFKSDKEGNIITKNISKHVSSSLDKEALRLFNLIEWDPALEYGIPVESNGTFEMTFKIKKYKKLVSRRIYQPHNLNFPSDSSLIIFNVKQIDTIAEPILVNKETNLYNYIYSVMQYPKQAVELGIEGKVVISFVIETSGCPSNIIVEQTVGGGCTEEALRIVSDLRWIPAIKNGMLVRSRKQIYIDFRLVMDSNGNFIPNQTNSGL